MTKKILTTLVALVMVSISFACDFCNCYLGINPHFKKNKIGLRESYNYSSLKNVFVNETEIEKYTEHRSSTELFAEIFPVQKLQVLFTLPYVTNTSKITQGAHLHQRFASTQSSQHFSDPSSVESVNNKITYSGIGDATLLLHYQVFNLHAMDSGKISHRFMAGGGVRFPTGNSKVKNNDVTEQMHTPGTGSFSELISVVYLARRNKISFAYNANILFSQYNKKDFKPGTRFNTAANFYYSVGKKEKYIPSVGCSYEISDKNVLNNSELESSGGHILFVQSGHDFYFGRFSFSVSAFIPVTQNVDGLQAKNKFRALAALSYAW